MFSERNSVDKCAEAVDDYTSKDHKLSLQSIWSYSHLIKLVINSDKLTPRICK